MTAEHVSARQIVKTLKGRWYRGYGMCRCPAHPDKEPSLSVTEKYNRVLVKCWAGCPQENVIDALRGENLWPSRDDFGITRKFGPKPRPVPSATEPDDDELAAMRAAREIWRHAQPIGNDAAWLYLWSRGIANQIPPSLRFHPSLYNAELKKPLPALVAAIQDSTGHITAVHRIWVRSRYVCENGIPAQPSMKADVRIAKKTLGMMFDGAVRLSKPGATLGIAEGIETALAARKLYSLPVWAALGAARMGRIALPDCVSRIVLFADNGAAGEKAADRAQQDFEAQGIGAAIEYPPAEFSDFNQWLQEK